MITFSQFLSATIGPSVALVSAPSTIPSLNRHPTMVVPVLVAFGSGIPFSAKKLFLEVFEKSKPGGLYIEFMVEEILSGTRNASRRVSDQLSATLDQIGHACFRTTVTSNL